MNLVHYSAWPLSLDLIRKRVQGREHDLSFKPRGLWLSDNDEDYNWPAWCLGEGFQLERLRWAYQVRLKPGARIFHIKDKHQLQAFDLAFGYSPPHWPPEISSRFHIDWGRLAEWYDGILITHTSTKCASTCSGITPGT